MIKQMTPFKPTPDEYLRRIFDKELNQKIEAYEKAHPEEYMPLPPLDLRTIPREEWDHYQYRRLIWPPDIQLYVESTNGTKAVAVDQGWELDLADPDSDPFDLEADAPKVDPDLPLGQRKPGGLGVHLIKKLMDRIECRYGGRTATFTLFKRLE